MLCTYNHKIHAYSFFFLYYKKLKIYYNFFSKFMRVYHSKIFEYYIYISLLLYDDDYIKFSNTYI